MIERFDLFQESQPRICLWCRDCGVVFCGGTWGYVCLRHGNHRDLTKRMKGVLTPFPPNVEFRTGVQCVNPDESHDCFRPTPRDSARSGLLEDMGYLEGA